MVQMNISDFGQKTLKGASNLTTKPTITPEQTQEIVAFAKQNGDNPAEVIANLQSEGFEFVGRDLATNKTAEQSALANPKDKASTDIYNIGEKALGKKKLLEKLNITGRLGDIGTDIVGGVAESTSGLAELAGKGLVSGIGWLSKKLGADENKVNDLVVSYKSSRDTLGGETIGDEDSNVYKGAKMIADIAQTAAAGGAIKSGIKAGVKGTAIIGMTDDLAAGGAKILEGMGMGAKTAAKSIEVAGKILAGGALGAAEMGIYEGISEGEMASKGELGLGAAIGSTIPLAGAVLKGISKPLYEKFINVVDDPIKKSLGRMDAVSADKIMKEATESATDYTKTGPITRLSKNLWDDLKKIVDPLRKKTGGELGALRSDMSTKVADKSAKSIMSKFNRMLGVNNLKISSNKIIGTETLHNKKLIKPAQEILDHLKGLLENPSYKNLRLIDDILEKDIKRLVTQGGDASIFQTLGGKVGAEISKLTPGAVSTKSTEYAGLKELMKGLDKTSETKKGYSLLTQIGSKSKDQLMGYLNEIDKITGKNYSDQLVLANWAEKTARQTAKAGGAELFRPSMGGAAKGTLDMVLSARHKPFEQAMKLVGDYVKPTASTAKKIVSQAAGLGAKGARLETVQSLTD